MIKTSKKWFPIQSDNACLLKWAWSSLYLWTGTSSSCHRVQNVSVDNIENFHNTSTVVLDREKMLEGKWPGRGCEHCKDQELYSDFSDRKHWLSNPENQRYVPVELYNDPTRTSVNPTMVEIYFNNKCNLKCLYCGPFLSSAWALENEQHGIEDNTNYINDALYKKRLQEFYTWMEKHYLNLREFHILGGEPLIQQETFDCIDWMIDHPNVDLDVEIFSNMQIKPALFKRQMEKIKELVNACKTVEIVASIDCWGKESEYIRSGLDLSTFTENMEHLIYECPEIIPTMNWTVSSLSIHSTPELIKKVINWNDKCKGRKISVNYNKVVHPEILDPHHLPEEVYISKIKEIQELNVQMINNPTYLDYVNAIFKEIVETPTNHNMIKELKIFLDDIDKRRNTDWRSIFPWLINI
jgi:organic radical activating enzyme